VSNARNYVSYSQMMQTEKNVATLPLNVTRKATPSTPGHTSQDPWVTRSHQVLNSPETFTLRYE
jgi:hypothetical protein